MKSEIRGDVELTTRNEKQPLVDSDNDDDDEEFGDDYINQQLNATVWSDLWQALYDVRLSAPICAFLGLLLAYHLTIAPYRTNVLDKTTANSITDLVGLT